MIRLVAAAIIAAASTAAADATVPIAGSKSAVGAAAGKRWQEGCARVLEQAQAAAAKQEPLFARAKVEEVTRGYAVPGDKTIEAVEMRLDETVAPQPGIGVYYFAVLVVPRSQLWSDDAAATQREWTTASSRDLYTYRQNRQFEGSITVRGLERSLSNARLRRLVEEIFKPAVDGCMAQRWR